MFEDVITHLNIRITLLCLSSAPCGAPKGAMGAQNIRRPDVANSLVPRFLSSKLKYNEQLMIRLLSEGLGLMQLPILSDEQHSPPSAPEGVPKGSSRT